MLGLIVLLQSLTLAVSGPATSPEYLPVRLAAAKGHFARAGLAVDLRPARSAPDAAEALADGRVDLAATSLRAVLRFGLRGPAPPQIVFALTAAPPVALLVARAQARAVRTPRELAGRTVAVAAPGAPERAWLAAFLDRAGVAPARVAMVSVGARGLERALAAGEAQAALVPEPLASLLLVEGRATRLADFRSPAAAAAALGEPTVHAALFARADRRPADDTLERLARALLAALGDVEAVGAFLPGGETTPEAVAATVDLVRAHTPLSAAATVPRPSRLLHLDPLRRALTSRRAP